MPQTTDGIIERFISEKFIVPSITGYGITKLGAMLLPFLVRNFVRRTLFLRTMSDNRVKDFFYTGNAMHGEPDYGLVNDLVRTTEAFANTTYQSVYIIDYFKWNIKIKTRKI